MKGKVLKFIYGSKNTFLNFDYRFLQKRKQYF